MKKLIIEKILASQEANERKRGGGGLCEEANRKIKKIGGEDADEENSSRTR